MLVVPAADKINAPQRRGRVIIKMAAGGYPCGRQIVTQLAQALQIARDIGFSAGEQIIYGNVIQMRVEAGPGDVQALSARQAQKVSKLIMFAHPGEDPTAPGSAPPQTHLAARGCVGVYFRLGQEEIVQRIRPVKRADAVIHMHAGGKVTNTQLCQHIRRGPRPSVDIRMDRRLQRQLMLLRKLHNPVIAPAQSIGVNHIHVVQIIGRDLDLPAPHAIHKLRRALGPTRYIMAHLPR